MISILKSSSRIKIFGRSYQADRRIVGGSPQGILRKATDILFLKKLTFLRVSFCKLLPWPAKTNERTNERNWWERAQLVGPVSFTTLLNVGRTFPDASFRASRRQGTPQFRTTLHRERERKRERIKGNRWKV